MKPKEPRNLYELKPRRLVEWEVSQESRVTLLIPKFSKGFLARALQPRLRRPLFRINLDEFGSFVWLSCDGNADVRSIGEHMMDKYGPAAEPVFDRIAQFLRQLESSNFIDFPTSTANPHKNLP